MLRITTIAGQDASETLILEGKLVEPWVSALLDACAALATRSNPGRLDLSGVTFADRAGAAALRILTRRGMAIVACSGFVAELLKGTLTGCREPNGACCPRRDTVQTSCLGSEEADLLARIRAGDEAACAALVRQYAGRMLAVARRFLHSEEDSADVVQDAFLAAFRALASFEGKSSLGTWLHRIVVNASLAKLRSRSRHPTVSLDELLPAFDESGHHARPVLAWTPPASRRLDQAETRAHVRAAIDRLPESYRTVLLLRDIEGFGTEETAHQLGLSRAAVKTRLHRARQALRTLLEPVFGAELSG
jgi:RNA polymerase sigma-70 factor (ECF subfamily)